MDNLVAACQPCNRSKGDRTPDEWKTPNGRQHWRLRFVVAPVERADVWGKSLGNLGFRLRRLVLDSAF
jgi:hypothetical protein